MSIFSAAIAMVVPLVGAVPLVDDACRPSVPRLGRCPIGQRRHRADGLDGGLLRPDEFARHVTLVREPAGESASQLGGEPVVAALGPAPRALVRQRGASAPDVLADRRARQPPAARDAARRDRRGDRCGHPSVRRPVRGWGRVVGLRFRPGGLAALTGLPASAWTDRSVAAGGAARGPGRRLADPDLAASGTAWAEAAEQGLAALADEPARPALRPPPRRRRRHAGRPRPCSPWPMSPTARRDGAHPSAAVHALRRGGAEVGALALPDARRGRRARCRLGRHAHRPRRALRLVRPGPLHPRLHRPRRRDTPGQYRDRTAAAVADTRGSSASADVTAIARTSPGPRKHLRRAEPRRHRWWRGVGVRRRRAAPSARGSSTEASSMVPGPWAPCRRRSHASSCGGSSRIGSWAAPPTMSTCLRLATAPTSSRTRCTSSVQIRLPLGPAAVDPALEHDQPPWHLALEVVGHADHRALGDVGVAGERRLDRARRQPVPGDVEHVVGAAHDVDVAVLVDEPAVTGEVVAVEDRQVPGDEAVVVLPQRRQGARGQRQPDGDGSLRAGRHRSPGSSSTWTS